MNSHSAFLGVVLMRMQAADVDRDGRSRRRRSGKRVNRAR
jgi:hypothetical protein